VVEKRSTPDWELIEREYRAGQLSIAEVARLGGVSKSYVIKRAKQDGWTRNLADRVRQVVTARVVTDGVTGASARETVELAAERGVQIIREHRTLIGRGRGQVLKLFDALDAATDEEIGLKDKSVVLNNLSTALKTFVGLERQAFNLDDGKGDGEPSAAIRFIVEGAPPILEGQTIEIADDGNSR
jgi:hypothetical protein